jgi:(S)-ureidoglycine aminohydrolase
VVSQLPGWRGTEANILAAPALGAEFLQYILHIAAGGGFDGALPEGVEGFFYVLEGSAELKVDGAAHSFKAGGYAYLKPGAAFSLSCKAAAKLTWIKKRYEPLAGHSPRSLAGQEQDVTGEVYMGIEGLLLKHLIPDELHFDMAVNIFTFSPGTALPMIESHIMEHGLVFLQGGGMYYLGNRWMEVKKDDFIWMGPYCPQSFYPAGKTASRYIYYKNVNRDISI